MKKKCFFRRTSDLIIRQHNYIRGFGFVILAAGTLIPPIKKLIAGISELNLLIYVFLIIFIVIICLILFYCIFFASFDTETLKKDKMNKEEWIVSIFLTVIFLFFFLIVNLYD